MSGWIKCSDRMPEIDYTKPEYAHYVYALASDGKQVRQLSYSSNAYNKTEKGRAPKWLEFDGRGAFFTPTHWMPLPAPPEVPS